MRRILTGFMLILMLPGAALAKCEDERKQGVEVWYACMVREGLAQIPSGADAQCAAQAAAGLIPAFYCQPGPKPPVNGGYPTGEHVKPQTGENGYWPKECTPCEGLFLASGGDPEQCTPVPQFDPDKCDSKLAYRDHEVTVQASEVYHADGMKWSEHYAAAKEHAKGMEVRALQAEAALADEQAFSACALTARNRRTCKR